MDLESMVSEAKALKYEYDNKVTELQKNILAKLAESGKISTLYVYGYTPGFNDGDPCTHHVYYHVNVKDVWFEELDGLEMISRFALPEPEGEEELSSEMSEDEVQQFVENAGLIWEDPKDAKINWAIDNLIVPMLDKELNTNYQVLFVFKDGKIEKHTEEYDCGY